MVFSDAGCKMVRGAMVIARGVRFGTLYKLEAYTVDYNSTSIKIKSIDTSLEDVRVSPLVDGHGFWVLKGSFSSEAKLPIEKTLLWHERQPHLRKRSKDLEK